MKLRTRLAVTIGLTAVGLLILLGWVQRSWHAKVRTAALAESIVDRMVDGGRERCEAQPERWPGRGFGEPRGRGRGSHRSRSTMFAYSASLQSANPQSPPFPKRLARQLEAGQEVAVYERRRPGRHLTEIAIKMPWNEGPCALILVRTRPFPPWLAGPTLGPALLTSVAAVLVAILAVGPLVRRIRRLIEEVERVRDGSDSPITIEGSDELAELAEAFEQNRQTIHKQLRSLREREAALKSYIANTTHDVMLPLTVLQGHLVSLQQRLEAGETIKPEAILPSLEETHYLGAMLHNLNAAARLDAGSELQHTDQVELNRLLERVVERHRPIARRKAIALEMAAPDELISFEGDLTLLEQAVSNVVHNAVRYNRRGGHVAVVLEGSSSRWTLKVTDDGPGIPAKELAHVTDRAYRGGSARTRHPHGMGLGLHIARDVAERHGLEFTLSETEGGGLTVTFAFGP